MPLDLSRVLVTGGDGMIGRLIPFGVKIGRQELDVTKMDHITRAFERVRPSAVLHLAALDMRQSEARPYDAVRTNVFGTHALACAAKERGVPLVFLSSGAVFNGAVGVVHTEDSEPDPLNVYGQTKVLAEMLVQSGGADVLIIRTGWVFGGHQAHHRKFVDRAIDLAERGEPIQAVLDQWGSPTFVLDLVVEIRRLLTTGTRGIIHVVNSGAATRKDIADVVVDALQSSSEVRGVPGEEIPNPGPRRPASEVLVSKFLTLRSWQEALRAYIHSRVGVPQNVSR